MTPETTATNGIEAAKLPTMQPTHEHRICLCSACVLRIAETRMQGRSVGHWTDNGASFYACWILTDTRRMTENGLERLDVLAVFQQAPDGAWNAVRIPAADVDATSATIFDLRDAWAWATRLLRGAEQAGALDWAR